MSETSFKYLYTILDNRRSVAFVVGLIGVFILDISIASFLPFWLSPLILGVIGGIIIGSARASLFTGLGTLVGRFMSILTMILTVPGLLETLDYFLAAIGDVLGASLPPGSLMIIFLSSVICGLFGFLGGLVGGSATKITRLLLEKEEVDT
ncbi:MAG: hypothetical protein JSW11_04565 [Candidatus Heimdallarchaeota archaeon]|nr:MAG: hypothetical protein JSW11_04565 [Candidatus Heimdallarchaeota archaeon]